MPSSSVPQCWAFWMCACDRCRGRHWCESECPITVLNNDYGKCASLYVSRCWHMLSTTLNNLSHCAFSTSASRIKEHLKLGVRFRIGPPCTCWKWVLNTLQSCNPFCKRHRALAFFFFFPWKSTPQQVLPQSVCAGLQYNFTRVNGPYASFQQEGDVVFGLEPHWLSFHSQHFFYASAVRNCKRQPPWLVSAVGGACAQPSVICQRTVYLACFYDDCSQTFKALGQGRRWTQSSVHRQCTRAIGRIEVSHGSSAAVASPRKG